MQDPAKARLILIRGEGWTASPTISRRTSTSSAAPARSSSPTIPSSRPSTRTSSTATTAWSCATRVPQRRLLPHPRHRRDRPRRYVPRRRTGVPPRSHAPRLRRRRDPDGTFFYSSPKYPSAFRLNQVLEGGAIGMTVCARGSTLQIGREDGDLNFPGDLFMSGQALHGRGARGQVLPHGPRQPQRHLRAHQGREVARPRRLRLHRPPSAARRDELELTGEATSRAISRRSLGSAACASQLSDDGGDGAYRRYPRRASRSRPRSRSRLRQRAEPRSLPRPPWAAAYRSATSAASGYKFVRAKRPRVRSEVAGGSRRCGAPAPRCGAAR